MESINSAISGVKSALGYGDDSTTTATNQTAGTEPISGEQGKGTAAEPFDKGNETTATSVTNDSTSSTSQSGTDASDKMDPSGNSSSGGFGSSTENQPSHTETTSPSTTTAAGQNPTSAPGVTGPGPEGQSRPSAGERSGDVRPTEANENRPGVNAGGFGTAEPSVNADPKSAQQPETEHEGGKRPLEEPNKEEEKAIKEDNKEAEKAQEGSSKDDKSGGVHPRSDEERQELAAKGKLPKDPNDHSGEPMKMHGGGGEGDKAEDEGKDESKDGVTEQERRESIGQEGGGEHGKEKGTGEQWVKTSGFKADGGDFDASKPGAAREATRLMEEKGMHRDGDGPSSSGGKPVSDDVTESSERKAGGMAALKGKLHLGSGKDDESK